MGVSFPNGVPGVVEGGLNVVVKFTPGVGQISEKRIFKYAATEEV